MGKCQIHGNQFPPTSVGNRTDLSISHFFFTCRKPEMMLRHDSFWDASAWPKKAIFLHLTNYIFVRYPYLDALCMAYGLVYRCFKPHFSSDCHLRISFWDNRDDFKPPARLTFIWRCGEKKHKRRMCFLCTNVRHKFQCDTEWFNDAIDAKSPIAEGPARAHSSAGLALSTANVGGHPSGSLEMMWKTVQNTQRRFAALRILKQLLEWDRQQMITANNMLHFLISACHPRMCSAFSAFSVSPLRSPQRIRVLLVGFNGNPYSKPMG